MNRTARDRTSMPQPRPVERIELSESRFNIRAAAAVLFAVIAVTAVAFAVHTFLNNESGWRTVTVDPSAGITCGPEFVFNYYYGEGGADAADMKLITKLYTDVCANAYKLFSADESFDGINNIMFLNSHPNEDIVVDPILYDALRTAEEENCGLIYLGPVYQEYRNLFGCVTDEEAMAFDPAANDELRTYLYDTAGMVSDRDNIRLELKDGSTARLSVSDEYLRYAEDNGIEIFVDFFWLKNAFIADYIAKVMTENGYDNGAVSSYDGFSVNFGSDETVMSTDLRHRDGETIYKSCTLQYTGKMSMISLRDYPVCDLDVMHYIEMGDGRVICPYVSPKNGLAGASYPELTVMSPTEGCAKLAMAAAEVFIGDISARLRLRQLDEIGIYYVICDGKTISYTYPELTFANIRDGLAAEYAK